MSELPPAAQCEPAKPPAGYRAQYDCVSYLARASGSFPGGRFWHAEFKVPEASDFAEFDFVVELPKTLSEKFRTRNIKRTTTQETDGKQQSLFSFTLYGTTSYGNCRPGNETCNIQNGMKATLFYK